MAQKSREAPLYLLWSLPRAVPAVPDCLNMPCGFVLQESSTSRVCACSQEKECPVEKSLSNSPVKSEREVLLVGEFWLGGDARDLSWGDLALLPPTSGSFGYPRLSWHCSCPPLARLAVPGSPGALLGSGCGLVTPWLPAGVQGCCSSWLLSCANDLCAVLSSGIISTFLHVHPFGASIEYICSYLQRLDSKVGVGQGVGQVGLDSEAWAPPPAEIWWRMRYE